MGGGVPVSATTTTINKMCGSGLKAAMWDTMQSAPARQKIVVAGGMESMSNAPYLITGARGGLRLGHAKLHDHMFSTAWKTSITTGD